MSCIAIIPARGGSKGLPGKNLRHLGGKPLVVWSIEAAQASHLVTTTLLSSDDAATLEVAARHGVTPLKRPAALATAEASSEAVMMHALDACPPADADALVLLLQPTSPLRDAQDIDRALTLLLETQADAVISVCEPAHSPYKCFYVRDDGCLAGVVDDDTPFLPRQKLPRALRPNGAIYACSVTHFQCTGRLFGARTIPYLMPACRSIDIDVEADLRQAEAWLATHRTRPCIMDAHDSRPPGAPEQP
ncbi:MAG: cytidylyltransferase domain-containing protein [Polyangiales bacterium]